MFDLQVLHALKRQHDAAVMALDVHTKQHDAAVVYLVRNTRSHTEYGRDTRAELDLSLSLLFENFLPHTPADVLIFHEGDFTKADQDEVIAGRSAIQFHLLDGKYWSVPEFLQKSDPSTWVNPQYGVGYRKMIRWCVVCLMFSCPGFQLLCCYGAPICSI